MPIRYNDKHYDFDGDVYTGDKLVFQRPRRGIPITYWRHWYRSAIQNVDALDVSITVRHNLVDPDKVYVAYVSATNVLTVKSAVITARAEGMAWTTELTQANCAFCSLAFDGDFIRDPENAQTRVIFRTESLPWLFYSTTTGQLLAGVLGSTPEILVGANVTVMDAVRGVASEYKDEDQGLLVFYAYEGTIKYRDYIGGTWGDQQDVSLSPATCSALRAVRLFDWRIVLHVRDGDGTLHEVFTKMAASGWNGHEHLSANVSDLSVAVYDVIYSDFQSPDEYVNAEISAAIADLYTESPVMYEAANLDNGTGDYGFLIWLRFDERVHDTAGNAAAFTITDFYGTVWYGQEIVNNGKELLITFTNFNNAFNPVVLGYTPGTVTGDIMALAADTIALNLTGLVPYFVPPPVPVSIENIIGWEA